MQQFEKWVDEREHELFQKDKFAAMGASEDYVFQALVFAGHASQQMSLATTILSNEHQVPDELKAELKSIQKQLHDFKEKLRDI